MINIYEEALNRLNTEDIDHHYSDLYLRKTKESERLIEEYLYRGNVTTFVCNIEKDEWYEIPFAYAPYFEKTI